ncbi:carboxypeptidase-like regulatory domain-containing protein [Solirubrum puertoriconensis]|uniref:carboxypeptidase-like regulatory domain-containing protein n=1 Tax=Solirubrum puertoriconensis TaxID=1751427 RepID=UPI001365FF76|nr:carboxypeptidase-like regulatory domain-containing protein [Solirubrum puertoriconensis]
MASSHFLTAVFGRLLSHVGWLIAGALLALLLALGAVAPAQAQYIIRGVVVDKDTQEPLPFVSIGVKNSTKGTASNVSGEFQLNVSKLPQTLVFSEIAHVRDTVRVTSTDQPLKVSLATTAITLPEVKVGSYAYQLVDRAFRQMQRNYGQKYYGQAFYRQITRIDNAPTELQEVIWNVKTNPARIEGTAIAQGRFAGKQAAMNFSNFSLYTKSFGLYDPRADSTVSLALFSPNVVKNYNVELVRVLGDDSSGVAEINFETRPEVKKYKAEGTVWIDVETYKVKRYKFSTPNFTTTLSNPSYKVDNSKLSIDMVFQDTDEPVAALDHMQVNLTTDLVRPNMPKAAINVESFTFFYDTTEKPTNVRYARVSANENDLQAIRSVKYDPEFWANNPVVQRTPVEDEVIQSFEKAGAFGTMVTKPAKPAQRR